MRDYKKTDYQFRDKDTGVILSFIFSNEDDAIRWAETHQYLELIGHCNNPIALRDE